MSGRLTLLPKGEQMSAGICCGIRWAGCWPGDGDACPYRKCCEKNRTSAAIGDQNGDDETSTSEISELWETTAEKVKIERRTDLSGLQKSTCQSWQHCEFCSRSLLQSQFPGCLFSPVTIQNDKSLELFSPGAPQMGSLVFCPCFCEGKQAQVICVCVTAKHPHFNHFNKALWCLCLLRAPLFTWVCHSVFRVLSWLPDLGYNSASKLVCFVPMMILQ